VGIIYTSKDLILYLLKEKADFPKYTLSWFECIEMKQKGEVKEKAQHKA